jgi:AhpD family alkylhydroperoxidase
MLGREAEMSQRLPYPKLAPKAYEALVALGHTLNTESALGPVLLGLVYLRASWLNGCEFCVGMHTAELERHHEPGTRIDELKSVAVGEWGSSEAFTQKEQAALAWTDAVTNVQDGHVPDEAFAAVSEFFQGKDLVDLTFAIAQINAWNRLGIAFKTEWQPVGRKAKS